MLLTFLGFLLGVDVVPEKTVAICTQGHVFLLRGSPQLQNQVGIY
jgi:hypothetical protein